MVPYIKDVKAPCPKKIQMNLIIKNVFLLFIGVTLASSQFDFNNNDYFSNPNPKPSRYMDDSNQLSSPPPLEKQHRHKRKCQTERSEHQVVMKKYKDSTGYWVLYTQIVETRNIANRCNRNEYVYLAKKMRAGWLWNPKISSLVQYSLNEPNFITRKVTSPDEPDYDIYVNMSRNNAPQTIDLDRLFPATLARSLTRLGADDLSWSNLARSSLPILNMDIAYFELVMPRQNTGSRHLHILHHNQINNEILE